MEGRFIKSNRHSCSRATKKKISPKGRHFKKAQKTPQNHSVTRSPTKILKPDRKKQMFNETHRLSKWDTCHAYNTRVSDLSAELDTLEEKQSQLYINRYILLKRFHHNLLFYINLIVKPILNKMGPIYLSPSSFSSQTFFFLN